MIELIKENMRVFKWGLYDPSGLLYGVFRYEQDAQACQRDGMMVCQMDINPVMSINQHNGKSYPVDCYITLLAEPTCNI